jgi:hypothetical protein
MMTMKAHERETERDHQRETERDHQVLCNHLLTQHLMT